MVDLHLHSTASDGTLTPARLVEAANRKGVTIMAITDHDTCAGVQEARAHARTYPGFTLIPGVELSAGYDTEVHILGYGVDGTSPSMLRLFDGMNASRVERHHAILRNLERLGIYMADMSVPHNPGRMHIAYELARRGVSADAQAAMCDYLVEGGAAYAPRKKPAPEEAVRAVREGGGVPVLAHPGKMLCDRPNAAAWALLHLLMDNGLRGLECYHSAYRGDTSERLRGVAVKEGLLVTGGSDFHGGGKVGVDILSGLADWRDAAQCAARLTEEIRLIGGIVHHTP